LYLARTISGMLAAGLLAIATAAPLQAQGAAPQDNLAAMKREYRRPAPRPIDNQALVDLGRDLFFEPRISASGKSTCVGCHFPELGWVVTDARSRNDSGKLTSRKSQPLIGLGHAGKALVGWDGRSPTLEAQAKASIATGSMSMRETDTPVKIEVIEERIKSDPAYVAKFNAALPNASINIVKTPTLRSVALRPPYMHNASQATLHDVMRHYEKGGIDRPSRSPLMMPIELTDQERSDLIAFMETLTGTNQEPRARP
jgi:cytochrome c peroxidase